MQPITFKEAIKKATEFSAIQKDKRPHLLLGNGFSIAYSPKIFSYNNLLKQADNKNAFSNLSPAVRKAFDILKVSDFEVVIKLLNNASQVLELYEFKDRKFIEVIKTDAEALKNILAETIAINHPENPSEISDDQYLACREFLSHFQSVYTLNYDLLLYWTVMYHLKSLRFNDGFEDPIAKTLSENDKYYEEGYVKWSMGNEIHANIFFMHGGLHLYDAGTQTRKFCWSRTGVRLKEQILGAMNKGMFPLFVAEGEHSEKFSKINHSSYLARCYRSFQSKGGALFIFGLGLKENDNHICDAIIEGSYRGLFVSMYGDLKSKENKEIMERLEYITHSRELREKKKEKNSKRYKTKKLEIFTFQAETAKVWG